MAPVLDFVSPVALTWTTIALLACAGLLAAAPLRRPRARAEDAPAHEFSAARAMRHILRVARAPHPVGSAEHAAVRDYLLAQLAALGVSATVQRATVIDESPGMAEGSTVRHVADVENVIATVPGSENGDVVLLIAHYDSVDASPGANDNGAAVAALLEVARALTSSPARLRNDVVLLFSDAEEIGQLGARAFLENHECVPRIGVVLNFEGRGSRGPVLMFETGKRGTELTTMLGRASCRGFVSSLFEEVYRRLPNQTDFAVFQAAGLPGLNFAYVDGYTRYHSAGDTPDTVDPKTVQHQGEYALGMLRELGDADLARLNSTEDRNFFSVGRGRVVSYPTRLAMPLTAAATVAWLAVGVLGCLRADLHPGAVLVAALALVVPPGLVALVVPWLAARLGPLSPEFSYYGHSDRGNAPYLVAVVAVAVGLHASTVTVLADPVGVRNLAAGASLWWVVLAWATVRWLPGANYLLLWPLVAATAFAGLLSTVDSPWTGLIGLSVLVVVSVGLVAPLVPLTFAGLSIRMSVVPSLVTALLCGLLLIPLAVLGPGLAATALLVTVLSLAVAVWSFRRDAESRRFRSVFYALNADDESAVLGSVEPEHAGPDPSHGTLPEFFADSAHEFAYSRVPALPLPAPSISVLADDRANDGRVVVVRLASTRGAHQATAFITGAPILEYAVDGASGTAATADWELWLHTIPPTGTVLRVTVPNDRPFRLRLMDRTPGTPSGDLPPHARPAPALGRGLLCNSTYVSSSISFQ